MDDNLGQPFFPPPPLVQEDETGDLSGEDDEGPDWTKLKAFASSSSQPSLPKRGDKEFEPAINGPTSLQTYALNRARDAMFRALEAERGISNKSVSYAVWYADAARARVTQARGVLFNGMGHSVPRRAAPAATLKKKKTKKKTKAGAEGGGGVPKLRKHTELLPEEALYLIERGSLFCWKDERGVRLGSGGDDDVEQQQQEEEEEEVDGGGEHDVRGSPMSVQQAFAEMIGREDLTLERYQAYAYLKRLGFNVLRARPPSSFYPTPASPVAAAAQASQPHSLARTITGPFVSLFSVLRRWILGKRQIDWWKPLSFGWLFGCARDYSSVYRALRVIPSGHAVPLHHPPLPASKPPAPDNTAAAAASEPPTPYEIFYHIYKPNTPFRKTAPPPPDYSLVVVNARTTALPTIHELTYLWSFLPETGPPVPRARNPKAGPSKFDAPRWQPPRASPPPSLVARLFSWVSGRSIGEKGGAAPAPAPRKPNLYAVLKGGKKTVVIGIVDNGTVGFFRFGMGAFEEMPMI